jgi:bifunctional pyridoxal-dependent enzyme with beta-cystathionase and maltose regulon repressor activities
MCVSVELVIQHAERKRHTVICDLPAYNTFFHITSQTVRFSGKRY